MANPELYAEFTQLKRRYWTCGLRIPLIVIAGIGLNFFVQSSHILTLIAIPFLYYWFHAVAAYISMVNWRCPICQHRFVGLCMAEALYDPIHTVRCRYCGTKPDYVRPLQNQKEMQETNSADQS